MARNIEIKAKLDAVQECKNIADKLTDVEPVIITQEDIFFACKHGRLKLRILEENKAQLIYYRRATTAGPKVSEYSIYETNTPSTLKNTLALSNGILGVVRKTRHLYIVGRTRVHIDAVEGLGDFIELEVVMSDTETEEHATNEIRMFIKKLGINEDQLIAGAYFDLLADTVI